MRTKAKKSMNTSRKTDLSTEMLNNKIQHVKKILLIGPLISKEDLPVNILKNSFDIAIFIDGGKNFESEIIPILTPDLPIYSIGDADSLDKNIQDHSLDLLLPKEKDYSDLECCLNLSLPNAKELNLIGFSGGDFDHYMANIGAIFGFLGRHPQDDMSVIMDEVGIFKKSKSNSKFNFHGGFSLFTLSEQTISIFGNVRYEARELVLEKFSSQGLSNKAHGEFTISHPQPIFLYRNKR